MSQRPELDGCPGPAAEHRHALALALAALTLPVAAPANALPVRHSYYATRTPYEPLQNARTYQRLPWGFVPVSTETVSRHGTRASSDSGDGELILARWDRAATDGQLTSLGEDFGVRVWGVIGARITQVSHRRTSESMVVEPGAHGRVHAV